MRWNEALEQAAAPQQPDAPVTIAHRSGSYQDIYATHTYLYPAGSGMGYRTARTSVVRHILHEFDLDDDGWYAIPVFREQRPRWFGWMWRIFHKKEAA